MVWDPKDPWSKKSDPLEDALKQAQSQFKNLMPSFKNLMPSSGFRNIALAGLLVFLAWQSAFIVGPDEEGVVKRFGAPVRTVGPGPHGKIPFVETVLQPKVQKLHRIEVGFRTDRQGRQQMLSQEALMLTGDMNILAIEFIVQYKIKESANYLFNVAEINETIGKAAEAAMREVVGKGKIDEALTTGKAQIQQDTQVLLQSLLDQYQGGVQVAAIQLQDVSPPEAVAAAFKDVTNAKEDREKLINQSQSYRNDILPKAQGEAAQVVNQAKGNAQARLNRAQGEANRFVATLKEYNQAKDIISKRIYIETMEEILPNIEKVIIDGKTGDRVLPYLPLERLKPRTGTAAEGPETMTKQGFIIALVVVVIGLFLLGASPLFTVDIIQNAIVVQLGKPVRTLTEPGLYVKIPFVQEVTYFDKRLLDYDSEAQDVITQDKKTLLLDNYAKWRIVDPLKVYQNFQTQRGALQRLNDIIYSELRVELGRHDLLEIVADHRADLMKIVTQRSHEKASAYGIEIQDVRIKRADLPEQNEKAVFARMQAERERQAKQYRAEGAEEAQKIRSEAEKDREIILAQAYKESEELRGAGDARAFKVYADAYRQDPHFFEFTRSMEAYKKTFKDKSTLVMSPDSEFFRYLKQR